MKVGVFGGTFDPIHVAHLVLAEMARVELNLDQILFVPVSKPPHKQRNISSNAIRYQMVEAAIANHPGFLISDIEFTLPEPPIPLTRFVK